MEKNENANSVQRTGEGCSGHSAARCDDGLQLAMVYSPYQSWRMLLSPDDALAHGTLFEELYKPFHGGCYD
jgi:hypothetical protein